jgi:hypothetical protein
LKPSPADCFAQTYADARSKFLDAARAAALPVETHPHPMPGRDGELLALDVVRDGPADAAAVLVISSGCHGVEGFCGSGIQVAMLRDAAWRERVRTSGVAVLYVHALNPHGFSWWRRVTNENVDLNRNFQNFEAPLPDNADYRALAPVLVPPTWPPRWRDQFALFAFLARRGVRGLQAAISSGQHSHADGLFYGGVEPTWSHRTLRQVLRTHGARAGRLGWIDLHTGLGPNGVGERIFACRDDAAALQRARAWWGVGVTSIYDGSSVSARLTGLMWNAVYDECPQAEYTGIAIEYGTQSLRRVMNALRADQWLEVHPQARATRGPRIKQAIRDAFYTDTDPWKRRVVAQAAEAADQALSGLAHP